MTITQSQRTLRRRDAHAGPARATSAGARRFWVLEGTTDEQTEQMIALMSTRIRAAERIAADQSRRRRLRSWIFFALSLIFSAVIGWLAYQGGVLAGTEVDGSNAATTFNLLLFSSLGVMSASVVVLSYVNFRRSREMESALRLARERAVQELRLLTDRRNAAASVAPVHPRTPSEIAS